MKCYWNSRANLYGPVQIPRLVLKLDIATLDEDPTEVRSWGRIVASPTLGFG